MKAKYLGLMGMLLAVVTASAQTSKSAKTAYDDDRYNSYDHVSTVHGKRVEEMQLRRDGKMYKAQFVNDKMTELYVDGENIPHDDWAKYTGATTAIRIQIKLNQEQAAANAIQAKKNQEQDRLNGEQEKRDAEQAVRNEMQAKKNTEQDRRNEVQEKHNREQVEVNEQQAKKNAEQAVRNEIQEKRNREQESVNAEQAKKNAEQAAANERFIKELTEDLLNDKIIPNKDSLRDCRIDKEGMTVNGVKQPEGVFKKYIEKYSRQSSGGFNYSRGGFLQNN